MARPKILHPSEVAEDPQRYTLKEHVKTDLGRRLQKLMMDQRPTPWSQADLARAAGIGRDAVSTYVRGRSFPEPKSLEKMARALGVNVSDLVPDLEGLQRGDTPPALKMELLPGSTTRMWLSINQEVSAAKVAQIIAILVADDKVRNDDP
jgi:hypothetical protein